jgi:hypothetical protein
MPHLLCYSEDPAARPFKLSVNIHQNAQRHIPGDSHLQIGEELEMKNIKIEFQTTDVKYLYMLK